MGKASKSALRLAQALPGCLVRCAEKVFFAPALLFEGSMEAAAVPVPPELAAAVGAPPGLSESTMLTQDVGRMALDEGEDTDTTEDMQEVDPQSTIIKSLLPELQEKLNRHLLDNETYIKTGIQAGKLEQPSAAVDWYRRKLGVPKLEGPKPELHFIRGRDKL